MSESSRPNSRAVDKKVDDFCQSSVELLANIHERCSSKENGKKNKKPKRGPKKRKVAI